LWAPDYCVSDGRRQPKELWVDAWVGGRGVNINQWH
jgi:hypothetical protein